MPLLLSVLAGPLDAAGNHRTPPARIYDVEWTDVNQWRCPFYNDGRYGIDLQSGGGQAAGGTWPQPFENQYIYGGGIWFGSVALRPGNPGRTDTLVTFSYEPNSHGSEMAPVTVLRAGEGVYHPADRIFCYPDDWPPAPRERWVTSPGIESLVPAENVSLQDRWCAYSDALVENHVAPGRPQDVDVYQSVYAWNFTVGQEVVFISYRVRNSGADTLRQCWLAAVADPDVGEPEDDIIGFLPVGVQGLVGPSAVGYVGDADNVEQEGAGWQAGTPGAVGYRLLGVTVPGQNGNTGMGAFKMFTRDIDPVTDPARYLMMAGFDYRTGVYSPYDTLDLGRGDKRFVMSAGPFDLAPGQVAGFAVAFFAAPFGGPGQLWDDRPADSLVHLVRAANTAQFIYDQGWLLPGPPVAPNIRLIPGDNQVRLVWDNLPEVTPDPYWVKVASDTTKSGWDPKYRGYDFEGYLVYKSLNGSDWQMLAQCDIRDNGVAFSYPPGNDSALGDSLWIKANDTIGVFYTLLDPNVTNGFPYYYTVAAYDWNYSTTAWDSATGRIPVAWDTIILRSGLSSNFSTTPRWDASNYVAPAPTVITKYGDTENPGFIPMPSVVVPSLVTTDTYELRFLAPTYGGAATKAVYSYYVRNAADDSMVLDTTALAYTVGTRFKLSLPMVNGIVLDCSLRIANPTRAFDSVMVQAGSYPADKLKPGGRAAEGLWAFRGTDFEVEWQTEPYLTARVYDVTNGRVEVLYDKFDNRSANRDKADGWCFVNLAGGSPTDTLKGGMYQVYICGGYFYLNYDSIAGRGDSIGSNRDVIRAGDKWLAHGDRTSRTAPSHSTYQLVSTPYKMLTSADTTIDLSAIVKVVPNPYVVFNAWENSTEQRYVKFTHLPNECTIRIYTISGDLVKVIVHKDTRLQPMDMGGTETWNFASESPGLDLARTAGQLVAPGVYVYHVSSAVGEGSGKLVFIH